MSSTTQFPLFDTFTKQCATRHLDHKAGTSAQQPPTSVLKDEDLETLYKKTNFASAFETQRFNIMILGFRTGLRGDSLMKFQDTSLSLEEVDGVESLKFHLGTMKNMQGTLMNVGNEPYSETIFPSPDKRFCAIEAYKRQLALLPQKGNVPLFRRIKFHQIQLGQERGTTELCQGATDCRLRNTGIFSTWGSRISSSLILFASLVKRPLEGNLGQGPLFIIPF